jgi:CheY-like chemotaxis protein/anti-sigma regulatory factor (Ser/Thr protein kinase)
VSPFAVNDLMQHLASEFGALARERGIALHWVGSRAWVDSDPQLLRRVLQNFLSNAIRYTERGRVLLGCRRRASTLVIEVWDTGPGIAEADRRVIFEEFRRLDSNAGAQGLGLGLAIAERIGRLLQHPIELRSWPGRGTVFSVAVPRVAPSAARIADDQRATGGSARSVVLVVDNDPGALKAMQALLGGWQCEVLAARNLVEAAAALATRKPDVLLFDYHLDAGSTGLTLRAELGARVATLPCVIITADHSEPVRLAVAAAGCHLLHKPLKPLALKSLMARLLAAKAHVAA